MSIHDHYLQKVATFKLKLNLNFLQKLKEVFCDLSDCQHQIFQTNNFNTTNRNTVFFVKSQYDSFRISYCLFK